MCRERHEWGIDSKENKKDVKMWDERTAWMEERDET